MISEQDKQQILDGAYGITNNNRKVRYLGEINTHFIFAIEFNNNWNIEWFSKTTLQSHHQTLVGLWQDKPEPFDLEKALNGEVFTNVNNPTIKYKLVGKSVFDTTDKFYVIEREDSNVHVTSLETLTNFFIMYKDPEPLSNTVTLTLPCPLKEPKEGMYFIGDNGVPFKSDYQKGNPKRTCNIDKFNNGFYFATKEDAQAWLDAMRNNRR